MNEFIGVVENNNTTFNRDITVKDLEGNVKTVILCYCTIIKGKSMSYYIDIIENEIYSNHKDEFQVQIDAWIKDAKQLAISLEVPFIV